MPIETTFTPDTATATFWADIVAHNETRNLYATHWSLGHFAPLADILRAAEPVFTDDAQLPQHTVLTLRIETDNYPYTRHVLAERTITRPLIEPVTLTGSFKRKLQSWADTNDCPISAAILDGCTHNTHLDYLALRRGVISYTPAGKPLAYTDDGEWSRAGRQDAKPGRLLRRFLKEEILSSLTDREIEAFANHSAATGLTESGEITVVRGDAIAHWYHRDTYANDCEDSEYTWRNDGPTTGTLGKSCMRYQSCQDYFSIYTDNPEVCGLAILTNDDDELIGRALVWTLTDGRTALDRAYGTDDVQYALYAWAQEQGHSTPYRSGTEGEAVQLRRSYDDGPYPYMDTFQYLDTDTGILSVDEDDANRILQSTGGYYDTIHRPTCDGCGNRSDDRESDVDGNYLCEGCREDMVLLDCCGRWDTEPHTTHDGLTYCQYHAQYSLRECTVCEQTVHRSDIYDQYAADPVCYDCHRTHWTEPIPSAVQQAAADAIATGYPDRTATLTF